MGHEVIDMMPTPRGEVHIYRKYKDGRVEKVYGGRNAVTYRAKTIMSRIIGGGLNPNSVGVNANPSYNWGSSGTEILRVTGIALGNGGHLIYDASGSTASLPKSGTSAGLIVDPVNTTGDPLRPAMPNFGPNQWGYDGILDNATPGTSYEPVENGNVPWDGTPNITDNSLGVTEAGTTLYSETFRIPLDVTPATTLDGVQYATKNQVVFKATLPDTYLNYRGRWGFSAQQANIISEIGLISGYVPTTANLATGQVYSTDGDEPKTGGGGFDYGLGAGATNFNDIASKEAGLFGGNDTSPPTVVNGVDTFPSVNNTWNMIARATFPGVPKTPNFSLVFVWVISF